ncbi:peroxisomal-type ATPase, putative, partial [Eimeria tenella]
LTNGLTIEDSKRLFGCLVDAAAEGLSSSSSGSNNSSNSSNSSSSRHRAGGRSAAAEALEADKGLIVLSQQLRLSPITLRRLTKPFISSSDTSTANIPEVHWADVGGMEDAKEHIRQLITLPLKHPKLFSNARLRSGCLLFGPPGTGKTLLAKAIATECDVNFISVKGPEVLNKYIGESEKNVRDIFAKARACQPCVLFFDEIDALLPRRGKASDSGGVLDRVVAQVLAEMDSLPPKVFVIGATNRIELLDGAALRAGRLQRLVYVGVQQDKGPLLHALTQQQIVLGAPAASLRALESSSSSSEAAAVLEQLKVDVHPGATGADCKALCSSAALMAIKEKIKFAKTLEYARLRSGCLLFGPPGTGKTLLAKAIATECDVNFISVKGPEVLNKYIGESEKNVRDIFAKARACQPCVLFFDEIDALLPRRGKASDSGGVLDRVVAQVLAEMDSLPPKVFVIGATNRIELLDGAALRAGRLQRLVYVGVQQDKGPLLHALTQQQIVLGAPAASLRALESSSSSSEAAAVLEQLKVDVHPGATGADCKALCSSAALMAIKEKIKFAKTLESALGLRPNVLQAAALGAWRCIDHEAEPLGCTYTVDLLLPGPAAAAAAGGAAAAAAAGAETPKAQLRLMSNTEVKGGGEVECLQVWLGCMYTSAEAAAADENEKEKKIEDLFWAVSTLPAAAAAAAAAGACSGGTLQLLLPAAPPEPPLQQQQQQQEACAARLNGHKAAAWATANSSPKSLLCMHLGPPPCFLFSVHVLYIHLKKALEELRPSVSAQDLRRYERLREQYAALT